MSLLVNCYIIALATAIVVTKIVEVVVVDNVAGSDLLYCNNINDPH